MKREESPALIKKDSRHYPEEFGNKVPRTIKLLEDIVFKGHSSDNIVPAGTISSDIIVSSLGYVYLHYSYKSVELKLKQFEVTEWHPHSYYYDFLSELKEAEGSRDIQSAYLATTYGCLITMFGEETFNRNFEGNLDYHFENEDRNPESIFHDWHKSFRQCDVSNGLIRKGECLDGKLDWAFWNLIQVDEKSVLFDIFKKVVRKQVSPKKEDF